MNKPFKEQDRVFNIQLGFGTIYEINLEHHFPIMVEYDSGVLAKYLEDGRISDKDANPTLHHANQGIIMWDTADQTGPPTRPPQKIKYGSILNNQGEGWVPIWIKDGIQHINYGPTNYTQSEAMEIAKQHAQKAVKDAVRHTNDYTIERVYFK